MLVAIIQTDEQGRSRLDCAMAGRLIRQLPVTLDSSVLLAHPKNARRSQGELHHIVEMPR
jgi:hypothetical protein